MTTLNNPLPPEVVSLVKMAAQVVQTPGRNELRHGLPEIIADVDAIDVYHPHPELHSKRASAVSAVIQLLLQHHARPLTDDKVGLLAAANHKLLTVYRTQPTRSQARAAGLPVARQTPLSNHTIPGRLNTDRTSATKLAAAVAELIGPHPDFNKLHKLTRSLDDSTSPKADPASREAIAFQNVRGHFGKAVDHVEQCVPGESESLHVVMENVAILTASYGLMTTTKTASNFTLN